MASAGDLQTGGRVAEIDAAGPMAVLYQPLGYVAGADIVQKNIASTVAGKITNCSNLPASLGARECSDADAGRLLQLVILPATVLAMFFCTMSAPAT